VNRSKWKKNGEECRVIGYEWTNQYRVVIVSRIKMVPDICIIKNAGTDKWLAEDMVEQAFELSPKSEDDNSLDIIYQLKQYWSLRDRIWYQTW